MADGSIFSGKLALTSFVGTPLVKRHVYWNVPHDVKYLNVKLDLRFIPFNVKYILWELIQINNHIEPFNYMKIYFHFQTIQKEYISLV